MADVIQTIQSLQKRYSDLDFNFGTNPGTGDVNKKINAESVKQSIRNLLMTKQGERPFQPGLYSDLYSLLFEHFTMTTKYALETVITELLTRYEPRIILDEVIVNDDGSNNSLEVTLIFQIIALRISTTYTVSIERLR